MVKRLLLLLIRRWTRRKEKVGRVKTLKAFISSRTGTARRGVLVKVEAANAKKEKKKEKEKGMSIPEFRCEARYRK